MSRLSSRQVVKKHDDEYNDNGYDGDDKGHRQQRQKPKRPDDESYDGDAYDEQDDQSFQDPESVDEPAPELESSKMTDLCKAIMTQRWDEAEKIMSVYPEQVRTWIVKDNRQQPQRFLPLHSACARNDVPESVISTLLVHFPESTKLADAHGMLPLHYACSNNLPTEITSMILNVYPDAANVAEPRDARLPLHQTCLWGRRSETCSTLTVLNLLVLASPDCSMAKDGNGCTALELLDINMDENEDEDDEENAEDEEWYELMKQFLERSVLVVKLRKLVSGDTPVVEEAPDNTAELNECEEEISNLQKQLADTHLEYAEKMEQQQIKLQTLEVSLKGVVQMNLSLNETIESSKNDDSFEDENSKTAPLPPRPRSSNDVAVAQVTTPSPARASSRSRRHRSNSLSSISRTPKGSATKAEDDEHYDEDTSRSRGSPRGTPRSSEKRSKPRSRLAAPPSPAGRSSRY